MYTYPAWGYGIGWLMALSSMLCIPVWVCIKVWKTEGTLPEVSSPGGGVSEGKAWHVLEQRGQSGRSRASEGMHGGGLGGLQELLKMTYPRRDGPHERVLSMRVK